MTDYSDLIARLRGLACLSGHEEIAEAADALEAQARRIAELEEWNLQLQSPVVMQDMLIDKLRARIAELTAALDEAIEYVAGHDDKWPKALVVRLRAARAALEKK